MSENTTTVTYASAGVDVEAGDRAVELMKGAIKATHNSSVVGGVGGFAGLYDVSELVKYRKPYLATSTDGVGTKVAIAQALDIHDTIGYDLVGMVVDDIVVCGAKPLFMTDYMPPARLCPNVSLTLCAVSLARVHRLVPPWLAAKPLSTPACSQKTSTTLRAQQPVWLRQTSCSAPSACVRATC